jgi:hypothetical protein
MRSSLELGKEMPSTSGSFSRTFSRTCPRQFARKRKGAKGQPCRMDLENLKVSLVVPFRPTAHQESI